MGIVSLIRETGRKHASNQHVLWDSYLHVIADELEADWELARNKQEFFRIRPL